MLVQSTARVAVGNQVSFTLNFHLQLRILAILADYVLPNEFVQVLQKNVIRMLTFDQGSFLHVGSKFSAEKLHKG